MNTQYAEKEYMLKHGISELTNSIIRALEERCCSPSMRDFYRAVGEIEFRNDVAKAYAQMNPWIKKREIVQNAMNKGVLDEEVIVEAECSVRVFTDTKGDWWCHSQKGVPDELFTYIRLYMKDHPNGARHPRA